MRKTYVIYHSNCSDGFLSAYLFRIAFPHAEFIPAKYGDALPEIESGSRVFIVDFSYDRETLIELSKRCELTVLDHHKTAQENCKGLDFCIFDMDKCGARLSIEYLIENNLLRDYHIHINWWVDYVEDRDLWKWEMLDSQEINAAIRSYPMTFDEWDSVIPLPQRTLSTEGEAILRYRQNIINQHVENTRETEIAGYNVPAVYCSFSEIISDVAGTLAEGQPFAACYFDTDEGRVFSLRSRTDGIDVSELAKSMGGGGHKHAAGFKLKAA